MLWGGRFQATLDSQALTFSTSLATDVRLIEEDLDGSQAHVDMLAKQGLISPEDLVAIAQGLRQIRAEVEANTWNPLSGPYEDIHSAVESRLTELIGPVAGKLHTGRSRNDQVATDLRLWVKRKIVLLEQAQDTLQLALVEKAAQHQTTLMPGYTHLQRGQPISLAYHLLAYVEMLERDRRRLASALEGADESPLGSGALAGSTLPLDRQATSDTLGFGRPMHHALDAVSDRDFVLDLLHVCAVGMMHLSRLAEELILWATQEWGFVTFPDHLSTGSSLMPQKRNPDLAELIRGRTGRVYGHYVAIATLLKALPLSYNRDLQEDKAALFDAADTYQQSLVCMAALVNGLLVRENRFVDELEGDACLATDLADWLVGQNVPFREAHHLVGRVVQMAEQKGVKPGDLAPDELGTIHPLLGNGEATRCFSLQEALRRKMTSGSPHPQEVARMLDDWKRALTSS